MKRHIVIVTPYFAPAWSYGGPPRVLFTLAKELVKMGNKVSVLTTDAYDEERYEAGTETMEGIKVYRFSSFSNWLSYYGKIFFVPFFLRKTRSILSRADYVICSDLRSLLNWQVFRFLIVQKIPYGIFAFGQIPQGLGFRAVIKGRFDEKWVREFIAHARHKFCQTKHEQQMYQEYFGLHREKTSLLPLPVVPTLTKKVEKKRSRVIRVDPTSFLILFVGRFHYLKGVDRIIDAAIPVIRKNKKVKLVLVGRDDGVEGELHKAIPADIHENVIFPGPLYNEDVWDLYKRADLYISFPRFDEETSLASLEALSYGTPVITTERSAIPFLDQYQAGKTINDTIGVLTDSIHWFLKQGQSKRKKMKRQAVRLIHERYSSSQVAKQLIQYIHS